MSGDAASLPCPICLHTGVFDTAQSLKDRLIFVSTNSILCPVCQEEVTGLDKLTIHLFSHVKLPISNGPSCYKKDTSDAKKSSEKCVSIISEPKKLKTSVAKNNTCVATANAPVKYVKIYPKLPTVAPNTNNLPKADRNPGKDGCLSNSNQLGVQISKIEVDSKQKVNNQCDICGLQFVDDKILNMHKCLIHNLEDKAVHSVTQYDCHLCPKKFKMRGSLMVHLRVAHYGFPANNVQENTCNGTNDNNNDKIEEKVIDFGGQDGRQWQCDVCRKCFTTKYFLKKHKRLHTGETPYACAQCNKTFTFQQSYHKHILYHNDEKPHTCSFCGRSFKELSTLHNHQRIHTGEKPFACETCGKCFRQRVSYLVHRRIHTGVMPYKCTACEKSFRYKVSQRTHRCQAQPPGTVVRKESGDLVEKLKNKCFEPMDSFADINKNVTYNEISEANAELVRTGAQLSLEDMESDCFAIISNDFNQSEPSSQIHPSIRNKQYNDSSVEIELKSNIDELIDSIPIVDKSMPSPSEILQGLCLSNEEDITLDNNDKTFACYKEFNAFL